MGSIGLALLTLSACHHRNGAAPEGSPPGEAATEGEVEGLTIVVKADKSRNQQEENALRAQRAGFDAERLRWERERSAIAEKLSTLSKKDKSQREKLEAAEVDLTARQQRLSIGPTPLTADAPSWRKTSRACWLALAR